ncbi:hypothetical protein TrVFT333_006789 [Trichoderma virens FT-333]|nr:hypothetical protein TrVFT333_006789 [Trichoderma virens FT-333]
MANFHNIAVLGGTGQIGGPIVKALIDADFNVTVVTRSLGSNPKEINGAIFVTSDYTYESLVKIFTGQEAVVSAVAAGPPIAAQKVMVDAAIQAGVRRFIPSEYGSSSIDQPLEDFKKLMAPKTELIGYLREKCRLHPTFSWTCLSGGALLDVGIHSGTWGFSVSERTATIFDTGEARFDSTTIPTMARSVVSVLLRPADSANKYLLIRSFIVSQSEILAAFEDITQSKWSISYVNAESLRQEGWRLLADNNPKQGIESIIRGALFQGQKNISVSQDALANTQLGLQTTNLRHYLESIVEN